LRDRKEDIPLLVEHFVKTYSKHGMQLDSKTMDCLINHHWPGNIRELENEIKTLRTKKNFDHLMNNRGNSDSLNEKLAEFEKNQILDALKKANWVRIRAAEMLNIPLSTLASKIKRYNLDSLE